MFAGIKHALASFMGLAEHDAEAVAKAVHDDVQPLLEALKAEIMADVQKLLDEAKAEVPAVVADVAAVVDGSAA